MSVSLGHNLFDGRSVDLPAGFLGKTHANAPSQIIQ
jgi:hypothetical protein